ncbi:membrane protein [Paractinoplanes abujensis]|uniref:Putative membrane protein n=1 Tax=Paractinoplanes abujensis TaxID=882441 RepID=A0A7W7CSP8_9ACTN|nr:MauE/DoxX family redox-associated membrane protein [Actinoplanes abujensis]MBB4693634.1 putative membrane protein [Actinoplanes abujensis]GID21708.1 membrane protein [Actinoplanes abujensis]
MRSALTTTGQLLLGALLLVTGTAHLTFARTEFRAQVPTWVPLDPGVVVIASGLAELLLAVALLSTWKQPWRSVAGALTAAFFVAILPGNIAQFTEHRDAFGLDTDAARAVRLLFQPLLVLWALATTDAIGTLRKRRNDEPAR